MLAPAPHVNLNRSPQTQQFRPQRWPTPEAVVALAFHAPSTPPATAPTVAQADV